MNITGRILKTTTEDGLELDALLFESSHTSSIVIHFHGKEGDFLQNHFIQQMAIDYPKAGFAFMTASHRGKSYMADILRKSASGFEYTQLGSAFDIFEDSIYDIDAWVTFAQKLGYKKIILQQNSTPQKIVWYVYKRNHSGIKGLILISPADIHYLFEKYVPNYLANLDLAKNLIEQGKLKQLMPVSLWSNCPVSAETYYNWGNPRSPIQEFNYANPAKGFKYFPTIRLPILAIMGDKDFSVGESVQTCLDILKDKTRSDHFSSILLKNTYHSFLSKEQELSYAIVRWLNLL